MKLIILTCNHPEKCYQLLTSSMNIMRFLFQPIWQTRTMTFDRLYHTASLESLHVVVVNVKENRSIRIIKHTEYMRHYRSICGTLKNIRT